MQRNQKVCKLVEEFSLYILENHSYNLNIDIKEEEKKTIITFTTELLTDEIYEFLNNKNIEYELQEHEAVYNMEELSKIDLLYPESDAKNIFVRDDKKNNYYLITIRGNKKVDLKEFKNKYNTRRLSFASSDDLLNILNLTPGSVTPLGLLNDKESKVIFYIDKDMDVILW